MAQGLLGLPPGQQGYYAVKNQINQEDAQGLQKAIGLLSLRENMETAPLRRQMLEAQVRQAVNPAPKWQAVEQFNPDTGRKEKVLVDMNNPSNVLPMGGQEARNLSFQNLGATTQGLDPVTGRPVGAPISRTMTPDASANLLQRQFEHANPSEAERLRIGTDLSNLYYNTGMGPTPLPRGSVGQTPQVQQPDALTPRLIGAEAQGGAGLIPSSRGPNPQGPQVFVPRGTQIGSGGVQPVALPPRMAAERAAKQEAEQPKDQLSTQAALNKAAIVSEKVNRALTQISDGLLPVTGLSGKALSLIPGTGAYDLDKTIDTIKANVGFKELQDMRAASPTGGALGQIAVRELEFLQAAIASLEQGQSKEQLKTNLAQIRTHFDNWQNAMKQAYQGKYGGIGGAERLQPNAGDRRSEPRSNVRRVVVDY